LGGGGRRKKKGELGGGGHGEREKQPHAIHTKWSFSGEGRGKIGENFSRGGKGGTTRTSKRRDSLKKGKQKRQIGHTALEQTRKRMGGEPEKARDPGDKGDVAAGGENLKRDTKKKSMQGKKKKIKKTLTGKGGSKEIGVNVKSHGGTRKKKIPYTWLGEEKRGLKKKNREKRKETAIGRGGETYQ